MHASDELQRHRPKVIVGADYEKGAESFGIGVSLLSDGSDPEKIQAWARKCGHYTATNGSTTKQIELSEWRPPSGVPGAVGLEVGTSSDKGKIVMAKVRGLVVLAIFPSNSADDPDAWQVYVKTVDKLANL